MRVVVALGGNALLRRGEPMTAEVQRANVRKAAAALADLARDHTVVVAHGNGPQVGLLALQAAAYKDVAPYPLDILGAESVGMIGYLVEQELANALPADTRLATLLTQIEVERDDPAFARPQKPIGPVYDDAEAARARSAHGWPMVEEVKGRWRRVVPSPLPKRITQIGAIRLLVDAGVIVVCAGGGGIPVIRNQDGELEGIEAVIDKDRAAGLLAGQLDADAFLMLTDVEAVYEGWGTPGQRAIREATPAMLSALSFQAGSMGPKVEAACAFAATGGRVAGIGRLEDARAILEGEAGTRVRKMEP
ncbi:carbamate kinase [Pseudochelatococcus lubricantis]|uniref:Carbamate kinase n=1 Tax=Pseudochelatococcus lubricantis TaxID=1538102 RepID=A0ABX0UZ47_9HYPH|nr:carbamate kinase [Pseudochelatococcus lubricantis]NIJ57658.1 carbamate kinase [Pseudochelatococcus lubricantis]